MTITEHRPFLRITNDGDHDVFQHYFLTSEINENLMTGKPMTALCGKIVARQRDPKDREVCGTCRDIFENEVGSNIPGGKDVTG